MRSESAKRILEATRQKAANRKPKFRPGDVVETPSGGQYMVDAVEHSHGYYLCDVNMNPCWLFVDNIDILTLIHRPK